MFQLAVAQNNSGPLSLNPSTNTTAVSASSQTPVTPTDLSPATTLSESGETAIIDYKSVYDASTLDEEVKMAAERFSLTPSQQDVWKKAAVDRREAEKKTKTYLESTNNTYDKSGAYVGLRTAHNEFYQTIIGYLSPAQKQALETDRTILEEKRKQLAKITPPAVITPTVIPVDSTAIKAEMEKEKAAAKKSKKKKKAKGA
ncbi:MAG: hypothetical protein K0S32_4275 [Bacteroidetes bacterium]|jgi:hypothetical protein|nr:hypothetical protein [Bacteroidota bacterium]